MIEEEKVKKTTKPKQKKAKEKVGYRNPPKSGQFKPGQSGNPSGRRIERPLTPENLLYRVLDTPTSIKENGVERPSTYLELAMVQCVQQAARGDKRAFSIILDRVLPKKVDRAGKDDDDDPDVPMEPVKTIVVQTVDARHPVVVAREWAEKAGGRFVDDNEEANKDKWFNKIKPDKE